MNQQANIPLTEFLWFLTGLNLPIFLVGLMTLTYFLKRYISWLFALTILPCLLLTEALLTIALWFAMGRISWEIEYNFLIIFTPAFFATLLTAVPAYLLIKRRMDIASAKPHSADET